MRKAGIRLYSTIIIFILVLALSVISAQAFTTNFEDDLYEGETERVSFEVLDAVEFTYYGENYSVRALAITSVSTMLRIGEKAYDIPLEQTLAFDIDGDEDDYDLEVTLEAIADNIATFEFHLNEKIPDIPLEPIENTTDDSSDDLNLTNTTDDNSSGTTDDSGDSGSADAPDSGAANATNQTAQTAAQNATSSGDAADDLPPGSTVINVNFNITLPSGSGIGILVIIAIVLAGMLFYYKLRMKRRRREMAMEARLAAGGKVKTARGEAYIHQVKGVNGGKTANIGSFHEEPREDSRFVRGIKRFFRAISKFTRKWWTKFRMWLGLVIAGVDKDRSRIMRKRKKKAKSRKARKKLKQNLNPKTVSEP